MTAIAKMYAFRFQVPHWGGDFRRAFFPISAALALAAAVTLAAPPTASAEKGGKGGNSTNGGGGNQQPATMPPLVDYRVTWCWLPAEMGCDPELRDVNKDGIAVGWYDTWEGSRRGLLADANGGLQDLNDIFADALTAHPGLRILAAPEITASGKIVGWLVPVDYPTVSSAPEHFIVVGELYEEIPSLTVVDRFQDPRVYDLPDMNEAGDFLVEFHGWEGYLLYTAPYVDPPQVVEGPAGATGVRAYSINGAGQVLLRATFTKTVQVNRKTEQRTVEHTYLREADGTLRDLGRSSASGLTESGGIYGKGPVDDDTPSTTRPHLWTPLDGWQPVWEDLARVSAVSKDPFEAEIAMKYGSTGEPIIYREGYGPYFVEVTSGLNGADDVALWNDSNWYWQRLIAVSQREDFTGAGFILGVSPYWERSDAPPGLFILAPVPRQ